MSSSPTPSSSKTGRTLRALETLIEVKSAAGRPKDMLAVAALLRLRDLRKAGA